jgi:hypothetical protein
MRNQLLSIFIVLLSSLVGGCGGYYHHKVVNTGDKLLYDVTITGGGKSFNHGYLPTKCHKSYSGSFDLSQCDGVTVSWSTDGNNTVSKKIGVKGHAKSNEVIFKLDGTTVTVE